MKILILGLLLTSSAFSFPITPEADCEINYYAFCKNLGDSYKGMCPSKITEKFKKMCVISKKSKENILNFCQGDIQTHCKNVKDSDFQKTYYCLADPKKWSDFRKSCLDALASSSH